MPPASLISVVMPVYQGGAYLRAAVESVLAQTAVPFELVIGDDGSTDGSRAYLESLRDPRVRFFPGKGRSGLFGHLNRLLPRCRGNLIHFLCQDDLLEPGALAAQQAFFESHPQVGMAYAKYTTIGVQGETLALGELNDLPDVLPPMLATQHFFYHGCIAANLSTVTVRAEVLKEVGPFDESYTVSGDYELWSRIGARYPVGVIQRRLLRIRSHAKQLSRAKHSAVPFVIENARIRAALLPRLPEQTRAAARRFERRRQNVLDFHLALRCALAGHWTEARQIRQQLGVWGSAHALAFWLWTLNNRRRPQAPWVLPE
jgi:glycosyltransferase involved in cell wall biosynthesis